MTQTLKERDQQAVWHPFTRQKDKQPEIPIVRAEGSVLFDENGRSYIDAVSSWWVNLHGHAHPYIAQKIHEQAQKLEHIVFAGFTHEPAIELAERLLKMLPGSFSKVFYSDDGSTSTEVALKMALQYWWNKEKDNDQGKFQKPKSKNQKRNRILGFKNAYHGDTFGAMSVSDRGVFTLAFHDKLFEVLFIDPPSKGDIEINFPDSEWDEIACFIYEPLVQGAGGMRMYPAEGLDRLLKKCKEHGIICIADEVMTGFGRTGTLFASEYCEEKPDIICLSKGLTGGTMALGTTICNLEIYNAFISDDKLKTFFHGHSYTANPVACSAALASMDLLEKEECKTQISHIGEWNKKFKEKLSDLSSASTGKIKNLRQLGTILAFEIAKGKDEYLNDISSVITKKALEKGVYLRPLGNTVYIMPPYCIKETEINEVYKVIEEILQEL